MKLNRLVVSIETATSGGSKKRNEGNPATSVCIVHSVDIFVRLSLLRDFRRTLDF